MVMLLLEPGGLYYDLELKTIAALKPRPAFLPVLRMLTGVVEYDEVKGILVTENWQDRNRRASDYPQEDQRDRQTQRATTVLQISISNGFLKLYIDLGVRKSKEDTTSVQRDIVYPLQNGRMCCDVCLRSIFYFSCAPVHYTMS
jgi:hypothetical protein